MINTGNDDRSAGAFFARAILKFFVKRLVYPGLSPIYKMKCSFMSKRSWTDDRDFSNDRYVRTDAYSKNGQYTGALGA